MTTYLVSSGSEHDPGGSGPVPWRRMAWVTWRQHRLSLFGAIGLLAAAALYLWLAGDQIHHAYAIVSGCRPAGSDACTTTLSDFQSNYDHTVTIVPALLQALPALIGAFVGAPVLARELETGTFRYAWTQGFGRGRWTIAKLVPLAAVIAVPAIVFSLIFAWYVRPFIADGQTTRLSAIGFDLGGVDFAAWTVAAFALGALAGMLTRRMIPAIIATLTAYAGLAVLTATVLRHHYMAPLVTRSASVPTSALITGAWGTHGGRVAFAGPAPADLLERLCPPAAIGPGKPSSTAFAHCLSHHGYTLWSSYQPASRFWAFQGIEAGWLLVLSGLIIATTVWLVRRRAT